MGFYSSASGVIKVSPPITAKELRAHPELTDVDGNRDRDAFLVIEKSVTQTDEGELVRVISDTISPLDPDQSQKRYGLQEHIQDIVNAFPDRIYAGRIYETGEDGHQSAYVVRHGVVKTLTPKIVWPDEDE